MIVAMVNADKGWLFEDLKVRWTARFNMPAADNTAQIAADAYVCNRPSELKFFPAARTVVVLHDFMFELPSRLRYCPGVVITHPGQYERLHRLGYTGKVLERPIGAPQAWFKAPLPESRLPVITWAGRASSKYKQFPEFIRLVRRLRRAEPNLEAVAMGSRFETYDTTGIRLVQKYEYPWISEITRSACHIVCSSSDTGPLPLFEALAAGTPVVSYDSGYSRYILNGHNGDIAHDDNDLFQRTLERLRAPVDAEHSRYIRLSCNWTLESWLDAVLVFTITTVYNT